MHIRLVRRQLRTPGGMHRCCGNIHRRPVSQVGSDKEGFLPKGHVVISTAKGSKSSPYNMGIRRTPQSEKMILKHFLTLALVTQSPPPPPL